MKNRPDYSPKQDRALACHLQTDSCLRPEVRISTSALRILLFLATTALSGFAYASDENCSFRLGYAQPRPDWFTVSGKASLKSEGGRLEGKMFDSRLNGDLSHVLEGTLKSGQFTGSMTNLFSDEGKNTVTGKYGLRKYKDGSGTHLVRSIVASNPFLFVAITCHEQT